MPRRRPPRTPQEPPVETSLQAVLRALASPCSRRNYLVDWERFETWLREQGANVLGVKPRTVGTYLAHLREENYARTTIARNLSVLREVYAGFVLDELVPANPARDVKSPRFEHSPNTPWLDEEGLEKLLRDLPKSTWREARDRLCVLLILGLGWRRAEVARLRVEDLKERTGRGGAAWTVTGVVKGGKTLTVGVPPWLSEEIAAWKERSGIASGPLLPRSEENPKAMSGGMCYLIVCGVAERAGFAPGQVSPHGLRRSKITYEQEHGVSLKASQLAVGHSSRAITERYDRARDATQNAPGEVLAGLVRGGKTNS